MNRDNDRFSLFSHYVILLSVGGLLSSNAWAQQYLFNHADFVTDRGPRSIVTGDLNGDGKPDLVTANETANTVSVFLGKPDGLFTPRADYATGSGPFAVAVGDFNGDGKLDLVVVNNKGNTVSILLGNGDGTFQGHVDYNTGSEPRSVAVGDFNGDGKPDLAVANGSDNTVSVLLGNGDGTFQAQRTLGTGTSPQAVVAGDFNGDGKLDLAVANGNCVVFMRCQPGTVSVLLGNGDGTFRARIDSDAGFGFNPIALAVGDFNADGKLDLAVVKPKVELVRGVFYASSISILLGRGDGTFQERGLGSFSGTFDSASSVAAADFNGDGKIDLVVTNRGYFDTSLTVAFVLLGNGDGSFQKEVEYAVGTAPMAVASDDFNGDGKPDLAVANSQSDTISVLLGNGDGTFSARTDFATANGPIAMVKGDFNGDGSPDLAVVSFAPAPGNVSILLGKGDGTFQSHTDYTVGDFPQGITTGDFNGDGKLDLAVTNTGCPPPGGGTCPSPRNGVVSILLGNGDGTFRTRVDYPANSPSGVAVGDFNNDGKLDLAVANRNGGSVSIFLGNGDGSFRPRTDYPSSLSPDSVLVADFNGDGKLDLALVSNNLLPGEVGVLLGNGDGTFRPSIRITIPGATSATLGDFNGDGKVDLALSLLGGGVAVLLGKGDGTLGTPASYSTNPISRSVTTGDFNADGKLDLAVGIASGVSILLGKGDGTFQRHLDYATGDAWGVVAADFNGDGAVDLVTANHDRRSASVFLNSPVIAVSPTRLSFGNQSVGIPGTVQMATLSNPGSMRLGISRINVTGDYSETDTCGTNLPIGANCTVRVTFSPTARGARPGTLTITDSARTSPHVIALSGAGTGPSAALSTASLSFGSQIVSTTSGAQSITLSNNGDAPLAINSVSISEDFAQSNDCGASVSTDGSCRIGVTFTPKAGGARTGTLSINDNAAGSPRTVALSGTGQDFSIGPASGSSTSATITAGQTGNYTLSFTPTGGASATLSLTCSGAPQLATCSVSPSTLTLDGVNAATAAVTVATARRSLTPPGPRADPVRRIPLPLLVFCAALLAIGWSASRKSQSRRLTATFRLALAGVVMLVALWVGCGGGGSGGGTVGSPGTPPGTYTLTVRATFTSGSNSLTHDISLNLNVQ